MKHLVLLLAILTLSGCSLTSTTPELITNSGSTTIGETAAISTSSGSDLMSGEDLILSGPTTQFTGSTDKNIQDGVAYIQDNNVRVRSGSTLIQLTKNGGRTDLCDNGEPLEYANPQLSNDYRNRYLLVTTKCLGESEQKYIKDILFLGGSFPVNTNKGRDKGKLFVNDMRQNPSEIKLGQEKEKFIKQLGSEGTIITDENGDILFRKYPNNVQYIDLPIIGYGPLYRENFTINGNIQFAPDLLPGKIQKLQINSTVSIYVKIGSSENYGFRNFSLNLGINQNGKEQFTKSITGLFTREGGMGPADTFEYQIYDNNIFIFHYSFPRTRAIYIYI